MGHGPGLAFPRNELVQGRSIRRTASGSGWKHIQELSISLAGLLSSSSLGELLLGLSPVMGLVQDLGERNYSTFGSGNSCKGWHLEGLVNVWKNINTRASKRWCWLWENTEGLQRDRIIELKIECDITHSGTQVELL